jgi:hypothetical protein
MGLIVLRDCGAGSESIGRNLLPLKASDEDDAFEDSRRCCGNSE